MNPAWPSPGQAWSGLLSLFGTRITRMARCHWSTKTATVRERFSLSVILVITACFAGLFFWLRWVRLPQPLSISACGILLVVVAAQLAFRRWNRPWTISALAGAAYCLGLQAYAAAQGPRHFDTQPLTLLVTGSLGAVLGYFAGVVFESVIMLHDFLRNSLRAKQIAREKLRAAMGETPPESPRDK